MAKAKKTKAIKEIKKKWMNIFAPEMFNKAYLGETLVAEAKDMLGKTIDVNLMDLTKSIKMQNINIKFKVNEIKENDAFTEVVSYQMNSPSIKRLVRRNINKLDDSFIVSTSDGKYVRVKPLVITRSAAKDSVTKVMWKETRNVIIKECSNRTYESFIMDLVAGKIQAELSQKLNKIYPVRIVAIRMFEVMDSIKGKKLPTAEELPEKPAEEELPDEEEAEAQDGAEESSEEGSEDEAGDDEDESDADIGDDEDSEDDSLKEDS